MRIVCACLLFAALCGAIDNPAERPRFNARTLDGDRLTNESLHGKVVLLQFWTTWCPYCRREQPIVDALAREFADRDLVILAVNVGESRKKVKQYLAASPRDCPVVLTEDTNLAAIFEAKSYPVYVALDSDGRVAGRQNGAAGERALRSLLRRAGLD